MGVMSMNSGLSAKRYLTLSMRWISVRTISLEISTLIDSSELVDVLAARCKAVCPSRERSQLTNNRAAFGLGGWLGKATEPMFPDEIARLSFQRAVGDC